MMSFHCNFRLKYELDIRDGQISCRGTFDSFLETRHDGQIIGVEIPGRFNFVKVYLLGVFPFNFTESTIFRWVCLLSVGK